jgi:hypothetical protein
MRFAGSVVLAILAACSAPAGPETPGDGQASQARWADLGRDCPANTAAPSLSAAARDSLPSPGWDLNAQWAAIALRAPGGWGGYFIDDGVPTIYLLDPSQAQSAAAFLRTEGIPVPSSVAARQGRWGFAQLFDWYRYLNRYIWTVEGVSSSDIQEARNRLEYGVIDEPTRVRVEQVLSVLDIPCFLVALEIRGYAVFIGA